MNEDIKKILVGAGTGKVLCSIYNVLRNRIETTSCSAYNNIDR
jgi:hypothetical protein